MQVRIKAGVRHFLKSGIHSRISACCAESTIACQHWVSVVPLEMLLKRFKHPNTETLTQAMV